MLEKLHDTLKLRTNPLLFFASSTFVLVFVAVTLVIPGASDRDPDSEDYVPYDEVGYGMADFWSAAAGWIFEHFGWFFILGVTVFLLFLVYVAISRFGRLKLGGDEESPRHSDMAWFGMLFAAGIGTILMFWAVAEPAFHFAEPPRGAELGIEGGTEQAARDAVGFTLYHFGLHTWTIFTLPGLAFAYFIYKRNLPPRVSSLFQPILGDGIHGPIGKAIDIFAIVGTIFGIAMSIGLGTTQIHAGLAARFEFTEADWGRLVIIAVVTIVATISAVLGIDRGIKVLSNFNIGVSVLLLLFVLLTGPTIFLLRGMVESAGTYVSILPEVALWNDTFGDTGWQQDWTIFYWGWTISWAPFVGIFIARISRGRTVRQFVTGVLALPTMFTILWFGTWATALFDIELFGDGGVVDQVLEEGAETSMFALLEHYPWATLTSAVAIMLVGVYFITSLDSASLVLDDMCNGYDGEGRPKGRTAPHQRAIWAIYIGVVAAVLLVFTGEGGVEVLREVALVFGLPFFVLAFFMMYSLHRAFREDAGELGHLPSRRWLQTLPPEEYQRRMEEDDPELVEAVVAPDYAEGTQPENAPDVDHAEQPEVVQEYRIRTGEQPVIDPTTAEPTEGDDSSRG
ncbi:BCCT family transporter [Nesterenkonia alba]|uniref:BCCT family transporter n=1 Tax=Nesterenkonia alba TaxID=515814 RepID=UPI0003B76D66|nr:BCCT family transporter [Nesterenkonia alba]